IAAPASAAPNADSAISAAVTGRWGDIDGVWIDPVTAQEMMTLRDDMVFPLQRAFRQGAVRQRRTAQGHGRTAASGRELMEIRRTLLVEGCDALLRFRGIVEHLHGVKGHVADPRMLSESALNERFASA